MAMLKDFEFLFNVEDLKKMKKVKAVIVKHPNLIVKLNNLSLSMSIFKKKFINNQYIEDIPIMNVYQHIYKDCFLIESDKVYIINPFYVFEVIKPYFAVVEKLKNIYIDKKYIDQILSNPDSLIINNMKSLYLVQSDILFSEYEYHNEDQLISISQLKKEVLL